jgi:hypothetical protein
MAKRSENKRNSQLGIPKAEEYWLMLVSMAKRSESKRNSQLGIPKAEKGREQTETPCMMMRYDEKKLIRSPIDYQDVRKETFKVRVSGYWSALEFIFLPHFLVHDFYDFQPWVSLAENCIFRLGVVLHFTQLFQSIPLTDFYRPGILSHGYP